MECTFTSPVIPAIDVLAQAQTYFVITWKILRVTNAGEAALKTLLTGTLSDPLAGRRDRSR